MKKLLLPLFCLGISQAYSLPGDKDNNEIINIEEKNQPKTIYEQAIERQEQLEIFNYQIIELLSDSFDENDKNLISNSICADLIDHNFDLEQINAIIKYIDKNNYNYFSDILKSINFLFECDTKLKKENYINILSVYTQIDFNLYAKLTSFFCITKGGNAHFMNNEFYRRELKEYIKTDENKIEELKEFEIIFDFIRSYKLNYDYFLQFVICLENKKKENALNDLMAYLDLIQDSSENKNNFANNNHENTIIAHNQIIHAAVRASQIDFSKAYPITKQLFELFPEIDIYSRRSMASFVLERIPSLKFYKIITYMSSIAEAGKWSHIDFLKYVDSLYNNDQPPFEKIQNIINELINIYPKFTSMSFENFKNKVAGLYHQDDTTTALMLENLKTELPNSGDLSEEDFLEAFTLILNIQNQMMAPKLKTQIDCSKSYIINLEKTDKTDPKKIADERRTQINLMREKFNALTVEAKLSQHSVYTKKISEIITKKPINAQELAIQKSLYIKDQVNFIQFLELNSTEEFHKAISKYEIERRNELLKAANDKETKIILGEEADQDYKLFKQDLEFFRKRFMLEAARNCDETNKIFERRNLIKKIEDQFYLLPSSMQEKERNDFNDAKIAILMQFSINEDEADCISELVLLDNLFFEQLSNMSLEDEILGAVEDHIKTRAETHLAIAKTMEEQAAIMTDEEAEEVLIRERAKALLQDLEVKKQNIFKANLEKQLNAFIAEQIRNNTRNNLIRNTFLMSIPNRHAFSTHFVNKCLDDLEIYKKLRAAQNKIALNLREEKKKNENNSQNNQKRHYSEVNPENKPIENSEHIVTKKIKTSKEEIMISTNVNDSNQLDAHQNEQIVPIIKIDEKPNETDEQRRVREIRLQRFLKKD